MSFSAQMGETWRCLSTTTLCRQNALSRRPKTGLVRSIVLDRFFSRVFSRLNRQIRHQYWAVWEYPQTALILLIRRTDHC